MAWRRGKFSLAALLTQGAFLVLFILFVRYNTVTDEKDVNLAANRYEKFQNVHLMILVGFGFLVTFLKRYGYGGVTLNLLLCAFVIQWSTLMWGLLRLKANDWVINVNIETLLLSDIACVAVLVSFGALLGKASPVQLLLVAACEVVVYHVNEWLCSSVFKASDAGRSIYVHLFGAVFGVVVSKTLNDNAIYQSPAKDKAVASYQSDLFTMIGTLFLWAYFPTLNSCLAPAGEPQHRAILNTYFTLCACAVTSFLLSAVLDEEDKFNMSHMQQATLAGGVAVGTVADMVIHPWGAIIVGVAAALVAVFGLRYLNPFLANWLRVHDSRGVLCIHGLPGIVSAVGAVIVASLATEQEYGQGLYQIFPGRVPAPNASSLDGLPWPPSGGLGWSAGRQAGMQAAAMCVTLLFALVGGIITGLIVRIPIWDQPEEDELFEDRNFFKVPSTGVPEVHVEGDQQESYWSINTAAVTNDVLH